MMAFNEKNFVKQVLPINNATLYTVPDGKRCLIRSITINVYGAVVKVTLYLVPNGGTAEDGNSLLKALTVTRDGLVDINSFKILEAGGTIQGYADKPNAATLHIDGAEVDI